MLPIASVFIFFPTLGSEFSEGQNYLISLCILSLVVWHIMRHSIYEDKRYLCRSNKNVTLPLTIHRVNTIPYTKRERFHSFLLHKSLSLVHSLFMETILQSYVLQIILVVLSWVHSFKSLFT